MKRRGMLNSHISKVLADLGHTDQIVIADAGLPVPDGVKKIDLALKPGMPAFTDVVNELLNEMVIERVTLAKEIEGNQKVYGWLKGKLQDIEQDYVDHEVFKEKTKQAKVVIRTGETTPYANCILHSGVIF
ncbi:D-ribose pyranase [Guptibacillus hwajinpoensis]|uniref:D-ribose pyranase n=1 Tax=Guptibacillus hwajinpoensis TaxID=208199 RepID=UPI001CFE439D|nr:D-ribose pyranase [Pseudalkalibacillus hwajinpoensis]WLR58718.1 D-ribose pyranase [Pseudalkalibacillus hwajinpoensis]